MKKLISSLVVLMLNIPAFSAFDPHAHKITTPSGRTAYPGKQYSIGAMETGTANREKEERRKKETEAKGDVYPAKFEVPSFPTQRDWAEMKALLKDGDQTWSFHGLDSGWIVLRQEKEIYQLVTDHDY